MTDTSALTSAVCQTVEKYLTANDIEFEATRRSHLRCGAPRRTPTAHDCLDPRRCLPVSINAFIIRNPDENHAEVYRWLLKRNRRMYAVSYAIDHLGDIYLVGKVALKAIDDDEFDRLLGTILENSDGAFDALLELRFSTAIKREWQWRLSRESRLRTSPPSRTSWNQRPTMRRTRRGRVGRIAACGRIAHDFSTARNPHPAAPRSKHLELENLFTGWVDVELTERAHRGDPRRNDDG